MAAPALTSGLFMPVATADADSQRGVSQSGSRCTHPARRRKFRHGTHKTGGGVGHGSAFPGNRRRLHQDVRIDRPGAHQMAVDHDPPFNGATPIAPRQTAVRRVQAIHTPIARADVEFAFPECWRGNYTTGSRIVPQFPAGFPIKALDRCPPPCRRKHGPPRRSAAWIAVPYPRSISSLESND